MSIVPNSLICTSCRFEQHVFSYLQIHHHHLPQEKPLLKLRLPTPVGTLLLYGEPQASLLSAFQWRKWPSTKNLLSEDSHQNYAISHFPQKVSLFVEGKECLPATKTSRVLGVSQDVSQLTPKVGLWSGLRHLLLQLSVEKSTDPTLWLESRESSF